MVNTKNSEILENISNETYHARPEIGSTILKAGLKSMAHFKAEMDGLVPRKESTAFDVGTSAHAAILEQSFDRYVKGPDADKRTKAWKEAVEASAGKIILKPSEYDSIKGMFDAFYTHPRAKKAVTNGKPEMSFFVQDKETGLHLKARTDFFIQTGSLRNTIVDYKTALSATYEDFQKAIWNYRYDLSAAHYMSVVEQVTGEPVTQFFWIVQEKVAPYAINIFHATEEMIYRSKQTHTKVLKEIARSLEAGEWPCYGDDIKEIDLPYWAIESEEQRIEVAS